MRRFLAFFAVLATVTSCESTTSPAPDLNGVWTAPLLTTVTFTLTVSHTGATLNGSGNFAGPGGAIAVTATGTFADPSVSLNISAVGYEPMNFTGQLGDNTISGTLNGSGFVNHALTFTRAP